MKKTCSYCGIVDFNHVCPNKAKRNKANNIEVDRFYTSYKWTKLRKKVLESQPYCLRCWKKYDVINSSKLEGHHMLARSKYPEFELEENNIIMICSQCNKELGDKSILDFELDDKDKLEFFNRNK